MTRELALPHLIVLATGVVGFLLYISARSLVFDPRPDDHKNDGAAHGHS
jgi:hypothetical protein